MEDDAIEIIPGLNAPEDHVEPEAVEVVEAEAPEVVEATKPEPEEDSKKYVPLHALHEERMRRKEMGEELERIKRAHQEILEQLKPKPEPTPDITIDPVENIDRRLKAQEAFREQQELSRQEQKYAEHQQMQRQRFIDDYEQRAINFTKKQPDFMQAYRHAIDGRKNELIASGVDAKTADMMTTQEEEYIVAQALDQGADPAERMYNLAKARGYKKTEAVEKSLDTIEKGQQSKSLSGAGTSPKEPDSFEALNEITDDKEFLKNFNRMASGQ